MSLLSKTTFTHLFLLFILALFFCADLFLFPGRSLTLDGHVHITTIAQFYLAMSHGEFFPRWSDGFANYGFPLPLIAQQTTAYLGGWLTFLTHSPVISFNLVTFIAVIVTVLLLYRFLRFHVTPNAALLGSILFLFAPYRISNVYLRGALPEFFATVFIPIILIGLYTLIRQRRYWGIFPIIFGIAMLILTHPMMLVIGSILFVPYALYLLPKKKNVLLILTLGVAALVALLLSSYYFVPLIAELKYFTYGHMTHFREGQFLPFPTLLGEQWSYFQVGHAGPKGEPIQAGIIETGVILVGIAALIFNRKKKWRSSQALMFWIGIGVLILLLTVSVTTPLYHLLSPLANIQYPWRFMSAFVFIPPIVIAFLYDRYPRPLLFIALVTILCILRFPQLYGKDYLTYSDSHYYFTKTNLHTNNMNTIWTGETRGYPVQAQKDEIISGDGVVTSATVQNSSRTYSVQANSPLRMVDYTFYFPGWHVYVDGVDTAIEFQDPQYRGVITYNVPAGNHTVRVVFTETKIRLIGIMLSGVGVLSVAILFLLRKRISTFLDLK